MLEVLEKKRCTGCTACKNICPVNAIEMMENTQGFLFPEINQETCVDCGLCRKTCPVIADKKATVPLEIVALKHKNKEIRENSTSGGAFSLLAEKILSEDGIVYGAAFTQEWSVKHIRVTDMDGLKLLQKSKYVQSNMGHAYENVKQDLTEGKKVLFSGTACQCDGLLNYLQKKQVSVADLYLCDLICHGVPSPKIWKDYVEFRKKKYGKIKSIDFRDKTKGWRDFKMSFVDENGKKHFSRQSDDYFFILFFHNFILREACHHCEYTNIERISDFTLGDFWGVEEMYQGFSDDEGISILLVNSRKGKILTDQLLEKTQSIRVAENECMLRQPNLSHPTRKNMRAEEFWDDYSKHGFEYIIKKYADGSILGRIKREYLYKILYHMGLFQFLVWMKGKIKNNNGERS